MTECMKTQPKILAKYKRNGRNQSVEEMRVTVGEFNGIKYLDFRLWEKGRGNQWFPTTRGVSIRERECGDLADVIAKGGKFLEIENAVRRGKVPVAPVESNPVPVESNRSVPPWEG